MRFLLSYAVQKKYYLAQSDITAAYLEGRLSEDLYMECPPSMYVNGKPPVDEDGNELVLKLNRSLYGLVQSGCCWQQTLKSFLCGDSKEKSSPPANEDEDWPEHEVVDVGNGKFNPEDYKCDSDYEMGFSPLLGEPCLFRKVFILNGRKEEVLSWGRMWTTS